MQLFAYRTCYEKCMAPLVAVVHAVGALIDLILDVWRPPSGVTNTPSHITRCQDEVKGERPLCSGHLQERGQRTGRWCVLTSWSQK